MNTSLGVSIDMFPSNIATQDVNFSNFTVRRNWLQASVIGNLGFEFRSENSGYFYLGASVHRPFNTIAQTRLEYYREPTVVGSEARLELSGNYLTVDFRYYFHEDKKKKKKKKK